MSEQHNAEHWGETVTRVLKANGIDLVTYVPDNGLRPIIDRIEADPWFTVVVPAREEEAVGIVAGAYLGGRRGAVLVQTSGFATLPNVLASLVVPFQIPLVMIVTERGTLGEFQLGHVLVHRTVGPVLQGLGIETFTLQEPGQVEFVMDGLIRQAFSTQTPVAVLLSPLLTKRTVEGGRQ